MPTFEGPAKPGEVRNPEGKNGHLQGWQPYRTRLQKYNAMPFDELKAIINDEAAFDKLSSYDRAAALQIYRIGDPRADQHIEERERGNDRIEGKTRQPMAHGGDPDNPTPISLDGSFSLVFGTDGNDSDQGTAPDPAVDKA